MVLQEHLHNLVIPQRWDDHVLGVFGAYLDQVAPIIREIIADLESTLDATDAFVLDTSCLEPAALEVIAKTLDEPRVVFRLSDGVLSVAERDHARATRVLNDLRAGNLGTPVVLDDSEQNDELQIEDEDHAYVALDALYEAADALRRHPDRHHEVDKLADACARCPIGAPFGMEPAMWHGVVFDAGALAEASSDLDVDEIRTRAATLYERLHNLVA